MGSYSKVLLLGRLAGDPEVRYTNGGMAICKAALAVDRRYKDRNTGEWNTEVSFIDIAIFGKRGEAFAGNHARGDLAFVDGSLRQDRWEDKQTGQKRSKLFVSVDNWEFVKGRSSDDSPAEASFGDMGASIPSEDVPF